MKKKLRDTTLQVYIVRNFGAPVIMMDFAPGMVAIIFSMDRGMTKNPT